MDVHSALDYLRSNELGYVVLIFVVFIVPNALQRFRIPAAISSFALGVAAALFLGPAHTDPTIKLLATLGIVTLFLHAGLDINVSELHRNRRILAQHILLFAALLVLVSLAIYAFSNLSLRLCVLVSLALVTPSTGFIIDSIKTLRLSDEEKEWIRTKAIAAELVALACMFVTLQSLTLEKFLISVATILVLVLFIPFLFKFFARSIAPFAHNSEFAFLIMLATACAFVTRKIGAYYLVGAFVVGMAARRFEDQIPSVTSARLIGAVEMFASFFVPFYFFYSGSLLERSDFSIEALLIGTLFVVVVLPVRLLQVAVHRRAALKETLREGARVAIPMLPTLVFTLVLSQLMREQFGPNPILSGGLVIYALVNSLLVSFVFKSQQPDFSSDMLEDGMARVEAGRSRKP